MVEATILGIAAWPDTKTHGNSEFFRFFHHLRLGGLPWIYATCPKAGKDDFYACQTDRPKRGKEWTEFTKWRWMGMDGDGWRRMK